MSSSWCVKVSRPQVIRKTGADSKGKASGMNTFYERMSDKYILISVFTRANGNNDASAISRWKFISEGRCAWHRSRRCGSPMGSDQKVQRWKVHGWIEATKNLKKNAVAHDSSLGFANFLFNEMYNSWILIFHTLTSVDSAHLMAFKTYELPLS